MARSDVLFDKRSEAELDDVHPDLIAVVRRAREITAVEFIITDGIRSMAEQQHLVNIGASQTLNSRHVLECNKCKCGCAVDLAAMVGGRVRWDWPLYERIAVSMKTAADELDIPIQWGGDWTNFKDGPHFQLPRKDYP